MEPLFSKFFYEFKICVAPENMGGIRASYAVPQVALNTRGSLDVGWDMTDHRKRGAPSGSVNFVFVSCGTAVHLERHEKIRNIFCGISVCCCCCLKKNQSTPRPSEHPPVMGGKMSKRLGGISKYKTSSWHSNRFPDADNIGSTL